VAPDDSTLLICPSVPKEGSPRWQRKAGKPVGTRVMPNRANKAGRLGRRSVERTEKPGPVRVTYRCSECVPMQEFNDPVALRMHREAKHPVVTEALAAEAEASVAVDTEGWARTAKPSSVQAATGAASRENTVDVPVRFQTDDPATAALLAGAVVRAVNSEDYPAIRAMLQQQAARMRAVTALEAAGEDEMALGLITKMEEGMDPVHREAVRLARELGWDQQEEARGNE
jgi:hypothetical protein